MDILKELFGTSDELQISKSLFGADSTSSAVDLVLDNPPVSPSRDYLSTRPLPLLPAEPRQQIAVTSSLNRSQSLDNLHIASDDDNLLRPDVLRAQSVFPQLSQPASNHVNLQTVIDEMPMYLLEEDEGNDEEIMRLLETSPSPSFRNTSSVSSNQTSVAMSTVAMEVDDGMCEEVVVETEIEVISESRDQSDTTEERKEVEEEEMVKDDANTLTTSLPPYTSSSSSSSSLSNSITSLPPVTSVTMTTTSNSSSATTTPLLAHLRPSSLVFSNHLSLLPASFHGNRGQSLSPPQSVFTPKPQLPPSLPLSPPLLSLPSPLTQTKPTMTLFQSTPSLTKTTPTTISMEQSIEQLKVQVQLQSQRLEEALKSILNPPPPPTLPPSLSTPPISTSVSTGISVATSSSSEQRVNNSSSSNRINTVDGSDGVKQTTEVEEDLIPLDTSTSDAGHAENQPSSPVSITTKSATPPSMQDNSVQDRGSLHGIHGNLHEDSRIPNKDTEVQNEAIQTTTTVPVTVTTATITSTTTEQFRPSFSLCVPESVCLPNMRWRQFSGVRIMKALPIKILTPPTTSSASCSSSSTGEVVETECQVKPTDKKKRKRNGGGWPKGKKRKIIEIELPKPPSSAYSIFLSEQRKKEKFSSSNITMSQLSKAVGKLWSNLSPEAKQVYQERSIQDRKRYLDDIKTYMTTIQQGDESLSHNLESVNDIMNKLVATGDDNNVLFCHLCKLTFLSLHNKQCHFASRSHSQALMKEINRILSSRRNSLNSIPNGGMECGPENGIETHDAMKDRMESIPTTESSMEPRPGNFTKLTETSPIELESVQSSGSVQSSDGLIQSPYVPVQSEDGAIDVDWISKYSQLLHKFREDIVAMQPTRTGGMQFQRHEHLLLKQVDHLLSLLHPTPSNIL